MNHDQQNNKKDTDPWALYTRLFSIQREPPELPTLLSFTALLILHIAPSCLRQGSRQCNQGMSSKLIMLRLPVAMPFQVPQNIYRCFSNRAIQKTNVYASTVAVDAEPPYPATACIRRNIRNNPQRIWRNGVGVVW